MNGEQDDIVGCSRQPGRFPKKAGFIGKAVVSLPRGPARLLPASQPLFIHCLARSLAHTLLLTYLPYHIHPTTPSTIKVVTVRWDETSKLE